MESNDFLGRPLKVGDRVVFMQKGYRNLLLGTVAVLQKSVAIVSHEKVNHGGTKTRQACVQLVRVD